MKGELVNAWQGGVMNCIVTRRGRELAGELARSMPREYTHELQQVCSLICRHATTYERIQERWCCEEMTDQQTAQLEKRESQIEKRIADLAAMIPCGVKFGGDPRGYTVKLLGVGTYNTWGGADEGYGVTP